MLKRFLRKVFKEHLSLNFLKMGIVEMIMQHVGRSLDSIKKELVSDPFDYVSVRTDVSHEKRIYEQVIDIPSEQLPKRLDSIKDSLKNPSRVYEIISHYTEDHRSFGSSSGRLDPTNPEDFMRLRVYAF